MYYKCLDFRPICLLSGSELCIWILMEANADSGSGSALQCRRNHITAVILLLLLYSYLALAVLLPGVALVAADQLDLVTESPSVSFRPIIQGFQPPAFLLFLLQLLPVVRRPQTRLASVQLRLKPCCITESVWIEIILPDTVKNAILFFKDKMIFFH